MRRYHYHTKRAPLSWFIRCEQQHNHHPMSYAQQTTPLSGYPANGPVPSFKPPYQSQSINPRQSRTGYNNYSANTNQMKTTMGLNTIGTPGHNSSFE
ncbi:hypothetical protein TNCT_716931 [Trichonephila clavata]|uniref:Uncharacterized protein n=1 Tax=Trichonephila clavata TaxID=2740835 RepID=A0A8X6KEC8_TRICU|nr:hypothetical protein TNCT_716931 [Trichonephila clavata]